MTDPTLRVLIVLGTSTDAVGGHVRSLAAGLVDQGHRVVVAGPKESESALLLADVGVRFVAAPIGTGPAPRDLTTARLLARWVKGADVVHAHGLAAGIVALIAGAGHGWPVAGVRRAGVPLVITRHGQVPAQGLSYAGLKADAVHRLEVAVERGATLTLGEEGTDVGQVLSHYVSLQLGRGTDRPATQD